MTYQVSKKTNFTVDLMVGLAKACPNNKYMQNTLIEDMRYVAHFWGSIAAYNVTGPVKTGHICTNYMCSENNTFLGLCL